MRRIDSNGKVKEFNPPREDIVTLSRNTAGEVLSSVKQMLAEKGKEIPSPNHADLTAMADVLMNSDFIPSEIKKIISEKRCEIFNSLSNAKFDYVKAALDAIDKLRKSIEVVVK